MRSRPIFGAMLAALALTACGHMPVSTMVRLRSFDFATFDPAALRAAVAFRPSSSRAPRARSSS